MLSYYIFTHFKIKQLREWLVFFLSLVIIAAAFGVGGFNTDPEFKKNARRLLHRDYAFESFAALVNKSENRFFGNFGRYYRRTWF